MRDYAALQSSHPEPPDQRIPGNRDGAFAGRILARHAVEGGECECAAMLTAGAYGGWYCPKHGFTDAPPPEYVIEAVRKLNARVLELENWKYQRQKADAAAGVVADEDGQRLCPACSMWVKPDTPCLPEYRRPGCINAGVEEPVADAIGPRQVCRSTCNGCPALKTEDWTEYPDGERDSGTTGTCTAAGKAISAYWHETDPVPLWCPAAGVAASSEGAQQP